MNAGEAIAAKVRAGLARAGQATGAGEVTATLTRDGAVDDTTFPPTRGETATTTTTAILTDFSARERDGSIIGISDRKATLAVPLDGFVPKAGDKLIIGGETLRIVSVKTIAPGIVPLMYVAQIRA